jgi:hypothetical protein
MQPSERLAQAIAAYGDFIRDETLARSLDVAVPTNGLRQETFDLDGETLTISLARAT